MRSFPRRAVLAGAIAAALAITIAVIAFRWGQPAPAPVTRPSPSPTAAEALTVNDIYETLSPSVVFIRAGQSATGTGLIVNADGAVLTAYHVIKGASEIELTFADGTKSAAEIVAADPSIDIAVLTPVTLPQVVVPAVLGGRVSIGDDVVAIGNQLSLHNSTTAGVVSGLDRTVGSDGGQLTGLIQFDAAVNPGSSGGPLVNARGQTIGIVVALANPTDADTFIGIGFAVPIGAALGAGDDQQPQL